MSIKNIVILMGLSVLFAGCSTDRYFNGTEQSGTPTQMGVRYLLGRGVPQDNEKAFYYFQKAARQDDPFAENEVAYMYAAGKGTDRDDEKAFEYYGKAAHHGLASAQYNLGLLYLHGIGTAPNRVLAMQWIQKSAQHDFEPAKIFLSRQG